MKNQHVLLVFIAFSSMISACNNSSEQTLSALLIENPSDFERKDAIVSVDPAAILAEIEGETIDELSFSVPYQLLDADDNGTPDQLLLLFDLGPNEKKQIPLKELVTNEEQNFPKRTQAELSHKIEGEWQEREYIGGKFVNVDHLKVPTEHTDHSWFIRYEGPGWESDKVGYRFYLDWRNATDIFGKKTTDMVLQKVGQDGFDSYHEPADWGMDVLKVGESLGVGSVGMWVDGKAERVAQTDSLESMVLRNGNLESAVRTIYYGWEVGDTKMNLVSDLSIQAGSRLTRHHLSMDGNVENLCTGIVKHEAAEVFTKAQQGVSGWGYLATYGVQTLAEDKLGMAIFFKNSDLLEITEDEHSEVVVLQPKHQKLDYFFMAAWEQEPGGITSKEAFINYLDQKVAALNQEVEATIQ